MSVVYIHSLYTQSRSVICNRQTHFPLTRYHARILYRAQGTTPLQKELAEFQRPHGFSHPERKKKGTAGRLPRTSSPAFLAGVPARRRQRDQGATCRERKSKKVSRFLLWTPQTFNFLHLKTVSSSSLSSLALVVTAVDAVVAASVVVAAAAPPMATLAIGAQAVTLSPWLLHQAISLVLRLPPQRPRVAPASPPSTQERRRRHT